MTPESSPALIPIKTFAAWSSLSRTTIWRQIRDGHLKAVRVGGRTLIKAADAQAWLDSRPVIRPYRAKA
jgi:excisionase family DNA binding protein